MSGFSPPFVGSIDDGTQSCRCIIFDQKGKVVTKAQKQKQQIFPQPGWCEQDPRDIIDNVRFCIEEAVKDLQRLGHSVEEVKGVGITNQRETTVIWDRKTGKPLHNAIVWLDTRNSKTCEDLANAHGGRDAFRRKCGLPISTYFSGVKLKWLFDTFPEILAKAERGEVMFGTVDSWLIYNLTGKHVTDVTNACRTMLMNLEALKWDEEVCSKFGVPMSILPEIKSSAEIYGDILDGPLKGIPVAACLGDQQSACVGHCAFNPGDSKNTYGTGCFLLMNTGEKPSFSNNGLLSTVCYQLGADAPAIYALEGSVAIAGVGVSWLRDNMKFLEHAEESEKVARSVPDTGGVYFVPAFSGLFAPYWKEGARGAILGLTQFTTSAHIVRALLEAVAFQTADVVDAIMKGIQLTRMKVDGGMTANDVLMEFQADVLGATVMRPAMREVTALGAALAAGLAVGVWKNIQELEKVQSDTCDYTFFQSKVGLGAMLTSSEFAEWPTDGHGDAEDEEDEMGGRCQENLRLGSVTRWGRGGGFYHVLQSLI
ncbi:hypothetical protein GUITHDRAFT_158656 [Guillardia theta CCMP2712]|uniref:Probable glycerol kinase n=1 Tax=Guillardia theta (strain CCMP2712) TaxID=905079 RepID=L1ILI6_GUITC|nr:hypothetical protein GUITHDRAFT_158656 [Guillardia theta CCMP2712]EKX36749.1 hypothetical protein GUITHDRAFT_158656 [Guillardia theta CCMP2712]|eukprot:XP_005823729.1 hypothetical protein GUITHDRAFT_158656 [Guillardia theta CCMP2712]